MSRQLLPDPQWFDVAAACLCCGYSLEGLVIHARCPECGTEFESGQLVLFGVPSRSTGVSPARRIGWGLVIAGGAMLSTFWPLLVLLSWIAVVALLVGIFGVAAYLLATSRRERSGAERFVLTPSGAARLPIRLTAGEKQDIVFTPWHPRSGFEIRRVGPYWRRLRIGVVDGAGRVTDAIFDAGIRCPDDSEALVREKLTAYLVAHDRK